MPTLFSERPLRNGQPVAGGGADHLLYTDASARLIAGPASGAVSAKLESTTSHAQFTLTSPSGSESRFRMSDGTLRWEFGRTGGNDFFVYSYALAEFVLRLSGSTGHVGIRTTSPTAPLDVNGNTFRLRLSRTPSSATDTGNAGDIAWDANYIYVCTALNTWKRAALATW